MYPCLLAKSKSRAELLDSFRHQQEELQAALFQCDTVEEENQVDQVHIRSQFYLFGAVFGAD